MNDQQLRLTSMVTLNDRDTVALKTISIPINQKFFRFFIITIISLLFIQFDLSGQEWHYIKESDGIKIYTRSGEYTVLKSFKGETYLKTTIEELSQVIGRVEGLDKWDDGISQIILIAQEENKFIRYYLVYDVQWPFSDRDLCVEALITNNIAAGKRIIYAKPITDLVPEKPENVRIKNYWQKWTMENAGIGIVHLTLEGSVDPGGNIPLWIVNLVITDTPLNIMRKIKELVEEK